MMSFPHSGRMLLLAASLAAANATADPLHAIGAGAFQHHDSGWIFPNQIGGFTRVGAPQDLDGTSDAQAYYARVDGQVRTTVVVDVYPPDSAAATAKLLDAKAQLSHELAGEAPWRESAFEVGRQRVWTGLKAARDGAGEWRAALWFIDTGPWIVKVSAKAPRAADALWQSLDDFVREQQWESLGLSVADAGS